MKANNIYDISGKIILITGSSGLLGRIISKDLYDRGANLVLLDVKDSEEIKNFDENRVLKFNSSVAEEEEIIKLCEKTINKFGRIDVLINSHQFKNNLFLDADPDNFPTSLFDDIIEVNLKGTFLTCKIIGGQMLKQKYGSIINFASTYGVVSSNPKLYSNNNMGNPIAYSASKGGIIMLSKYLASYWSKKGIRVNCLTPHGVYDEHEKEFEDKFNEMTPIGRMMKPEEILGSVVFLSSDASSYINGTNIMIDGGWTAW